MTSHRGPRARLDAGQSLAEMALALPILLALLIGIVELGRAWNVRQVITNAAREGSRVAVTGQPQGTVQSVIDARLTDAGLDPALATVDIQLGAGVGSPSTVQVDYPYQFLFLGPAVDLLQSGGSEIPGSVMLSTTTTMRREQP